MIDAGAVVALATNCNPGSSYTSSMSFCIALAVRDLHMTIEEAMLAATVGGAAALRRPDLGRLTVGSKADAVLLDAPSYTHLVYRPGMPLIANVWSHGVTLVQSPHGAAGGESGSADVGRDRDVAVVDGAQPVRAGARAVR